MTSGVGLRLCHSAKLPGDDDVEVQWSKTLSRFPVGFIWAMASSGPLEQSTSVCSWDSGSYTRPWPHGRIESTKHCYAKMQRKTNGLLIVE